MKTAKTVLLIYISLLLCACMKEDNNDCPEGENLILTFEHIDRDGREDFIEAVDMLDIVFFDERQRFYTWIATPRTALTDGNTLHLKMEAGTYHIVAWGNIFDRKDAIGNLDEGSEFNAAVVRQTSQVSSDPLYYAPDLRSGETRVGTRQGGTFTFTVNDTGVTQDTVRFMGAHHKLNVWLNGFPGTGGDGLDAPTVSVRNLPAMYDFSLNTGSQTTHFSRPAEDYTTSQDDKLGYSNFLVPHFDGHNDEITIDITGNDGKQDYLRSVTMPEVLRKINLTLTHGDINTIDVELVWDGLYIIIRTPSWKGHDIGGGTIKD